MPDTATVTAKTGPDRLNTAIVFPDIKAVHFDLVAKSVQIVTAQGAGDNIKEYELTKTTVITLTNTVGVFALTLA
jgi:hypothetical protein